MKEKKKRYTPEEIRKQADEFFKEVIKPAFDAMETAKKCSVCGHKNPICYTHCDECNCQL